MAYRAFVSSTYEDLVEHRAFVIRTLREAGFDVDPMESWTSAAVDARSLSLDRVEECDLLVLLVAMRRGYIPHGKTRSITQLEYEHAIERGVDVLVFLLQEGVDWPARWNEMATDTCLVEWRRQLMTRHTVRFFGADPASVQLAPSLTRWVQARSERSVPHQLPRPPQDFTGREEELGRLLEGLLTGGSSISGIRGLGGIGKTALALAVADRVRERFRDGQIYLDLKGTTEPLSPTAVMLHVIRALSPEQKIPDDAAQIEGLYRSVLSGKRVLVLLDNAAGKSQVEALVPPDSSRMLVTSRQHFVLPGLSAIHLKEMTPAESAELLTSVVPRIGKLAPQISQLCAGLPLALRLAADALATRPDLSPEEYARRLADEHQRIALLDRADGSYGVNASLSLSFRLLEPPLRGSMAMLSVFPVDFDRSAAASVIGVDAHGADELLGKLLGASLLEWRESRTSAGRYRMHDLVRLFASQQLTDSERETASERHARHYLAVLAAATEQYRMGGAGIADGLRTFDVEWENIRTGFAWCRERADRNEAAAVLCAQYPAKGAEVLQLREHRGDRIRWFEAGLEHADRLGDRSLQAALLGHLGVAYGNIGELARAIECHERSLAIAREIGDIVGEGVTLENLGEANWRRGRPEESIECYEKSLAIARKVGDSRRENNCLLNLALAHWQRGALRQAIEVAEQCLEMSRKIGDRQKEGQSLAIMGISWKDLGEPHRCLELSTKLLEIARTMGDRFSEGIAHILLGVAHREIDEVPLAISLLEEALRILREIGDRYFEGEASWEMGLALEKLGELERARDAMRVRLDYRRRTEHLGAESDARRIAELEAKIIDRP